MRQQRKEVTPREVPDEFEKLGKDLNDVGKGLEQLFEAETLDQIVESGKTVEQAWKSTYSRLDKKVVLRRIKPQVEE
jgi:hypothetical protein